MSQDKEEFGTEEEETLEYLIKRAEAGFEDAQYDLGLMYENGEGVAQDYGQGAKNIITTLFSFIEKPAYDSRLCGCEKGVIWGRVGRQNHGGGDAGLNRLLKGARV